MKRVKQNYRKRMTQPPAPERGGSTIVVVIALLSSLMILGFFFFSLASQENENAEYFKEASKEYDPVEIDPDEIFDCFLKQYILGAEPHQYNSVFYGGRYSLLPSMYGTDLNAFNGPGVNAVWDGGSNIPHADLDFNGIPDLSDVALQINQMPGAQLPVGGNADNDIDLVNNEMRWIPEPDVDYVYPDHNFPLMSYIGYVPSSGHPNNVDLVILPAGHRPQLMRNRAAAGNWYTDPATQGYTLRAHQQRLAVLENGNVTNNLDHTRFISAAHPSTATPPLPDYFTNSGFPASLSEGVWSGGLGVSAAGNVNYQYEANPAGRTDGSGNAINTSIYLDCDFPPIRDRNTNKIYVPMVSAEILDAEGLLNLNVIGNVNNVNSGNALSSLSGASGPISASNLGISPSEINPYYAMLTDPSTENSGGYDFADYNNYFGYGYSAGTPPSTDVMANSDWWSLLEGAPKISGGEVIEVYPGRYGEAERARRAWENTVTTFGMFPYAGVTGVDDNGDQAKYYFPFGTPPYGSATAPTRYHPQPIDYFGLGSREVSGRQRSIVQPNQTRYPSYSDYTLNDIPYRNHYGVTTMPTDTSSAGTALRDNAYEMIVDPELASVYEFDTPFSPTESAGLQLNDQDLTNTGTQSSLQETAPWTFRENDRAELIRQRFTTISHDLKTFSRPLYGTSNSDGGGAFATVPVARSRSWEWADTSDADTLVEFPRLIDINSDTQIDETDILSRLQPVRHAVFELLYQEEGDSTSVKLMRKLNVNGITEFDRDFQSLNGKGYIRQRGLVPHSNNIPATQLSLQLSGIPNRATGYQTFVNNVLSTVAFPGTTADQEFVARIDRQKLARDIYTLLYLYGHGDDNAITYNDNSTNTIYSLEECRTMAQFAVNMVDYMDEDDVITKFEYDTNLANGWGPDDYPFTIGSASGWGDQQTSERKVVYGVEEQQLSFNEAAAVFAKEVRQTPGMASSMKRDHAWTEWDDQEHHAFLFMELQNTSGRIVTFQNREWEVVVRPLQWDTSVMATDDPDTKAGTPAGEERHLLITDAGTNLNLGLNDNNSILSIGSVSNETNAVFNFPSQGTPGPARMRITNGGTAHDVFPVIDPTAAAGTDRFIDLTREDTDYRVFEDDEVTEVTAPAGQQLLVFNDWNDVYDNLDPAGGTIDYQVELVLRRRLNPARTAPGFPPTANEISDNPWVVVDRIRVPLRELNIDYTDTSFTDSHFNDTLASGSRYQPLFGLHNDDFVTPVERYVSTSTDRSYYSFNSIGEINQETTATDVEKYSLWHPHKNHEYHSITDLFSVPLYGPDALDDPEGPLAPVDVADGNGPWRGLTTRLGEVVTGANASEAVLAGRETFGHVVLNPWGEDGNPNSVVDNNRWYRVLELLDAPNGIHQSMEPDGSARFNPGAVAFNDMIGNVGGLQTVFYRRPGVLNLNTIRHPEVLAGLMDDPTVFNFIPTGTNLPTLTDTSMSSPFDGGGATFYGGDWWKSFAFSRDGVDPISQAAGSNAALPGVPGISRPFRSLSLAAHSVGSNNQNLHSIEHTILRTMPDPDLTASPRNAEPAPDNPRGRQLFEVGSKADHEAYNLSGSTVGSAAFNSLDYDYKYRMLKKVMNNSTLRSNTFFIFLQADLFEAEIAPDGAVRVGAKLPNSPGYRGFFIVDRTKAAELVQRNDVPSKRNARSYSFNPNFNWRALVLHRQRLN